MTIFEYTRQPSRFVYHLYNHMHPLIVKKIDTIPHIFLSIFIIFSNNSCGNDVHIIYLHQKQSDSLKYFSFSDVLMKYFEDLLRLYSRNEQ